MILTLLHTNYFWFSYSAWVSQGAAKDDISPETLPTHIPKQDAHPKGKPPPGQESPTLWGQPEQSTPGDSSVKLYYGICYNLPPGDFSEN